MKKFLIPILFFGIIAIALLAGTGHDSTQYSAQVYTKSKVNTPTPPVSEKYRLAALKRKPWLPIFYYTEYSTKGKRGRKVDMRSSPTHCPGDGPNDGCKESEACDVRCVLRENIGFTFSPVCVPRGEYKGPNCIFEES